MRRWWAKPLPWVQGAVLYGIGILLLPSMCHGMQTNGPDAAQRLQITCVASATAVYPGDLVLLHAEVAGYSANEVATLMRFEWTGAPVRPANAPQVMLTATATGKMLVHGRVSLKADPAQFGTCDVVVFVRPPEPQASAMVPGPSPLPSHAAMPDSTPALPSPAQGVGGSVSFKHKRPSAPSLPPFPWPPPVASARVQVPMTLGQPGLKTMGEVDARILTALGAVGYLQRAHYYVPGGYAVITRVEQIDRMGKTVAEPNRFADALPPPDSLRSYYRSLFTAAPGYYRVIVFVVTNAAFNDTSAPMKREQAAQLLLGPAALPEDFANEPVLPNTAVTALVYEYQKIGLDAESPALPIHSTVNAQTHLQQAGLWSLLKTP